MSQGSKAKKNQSGDDGSTLDGILDQWRRERPDIDPAPMAVVGAVLRTAETLRTQVQDNWLNYGVDFPAGDVLLTLRRNGRGGGLSPSALAKEMMLSTSAMTNRLDRLEKRGLLERQSDPTDRRGLKIVLTEEGFALVDEMIVSHVQNQERMLSALNLQEREQLKSLLGKIVPD